MAEKQLRVGVVGLGYWGKHYLRLVTQSQQGALAAICDAFPQALETHKPNYPSATPCSSVDELIKLKLDAVIVATQATFHFDVVKQCLENGVHVLCEKPLTVELKHSEELIEVAKKHNTTLMVGHTFLFNSGINKVKSLVDEDVAGQIYTMYATRTNMGPFRKDVNALWDLAPHDVSIFNYIVGSEPEWVQAAGSNPLGTELEDLGFITLGYANKVIAHIHVSWLDPLKVRQVTIVGSKARIFFDDMQAGQQVKIYHKSVENHSLTENTSLKEMTFGEAKLVINDGDIVIPHFKTGEPLKDQLSYFFDNVIQAKEGKATQIRSDAAFGTSVVRTMAAIDKSLKSNGQRVVLKDL